jgi:hypothetical protein
MTGSILILACGALAGELHQLIRLNGWTNASVACLPAELHQTPHRITEAVGRKIEQIRHRYDVIYVAYADCGTGGRLDALLATYGIERLPGAHCYEFLAGSEVFRGLSEAEPGSFYATDFLVRHFDRLVYRALGLDRHRELRSEYFRHYRRFVHLAQTDDADISRMARDHAERLGLAYRRHYTGLDPLARQLAPLVGSRRCHT